MGFEEKYIGAVERLQSLAIWVTSHIGHQAAGDRVCLKSQQVYLAREALEIQQRARMVSSMSQDFNARLPKVELISRWAEWLDEEQVVGERARCLCAKGRKAAAKIADTVQQIKEKLDYR